jgi:hypothetical protein
VAALKLSFFVKVLIHMYFWKGCQDCQTFSLAGRDLAAFGTLQGGDFDVLIFP